MRDSAPSKQSPTVFISYAHESDALRAAVRKLAEWLSAQGCSVMTDHPYADRPPPEGWQAWMLGCIEQADTVLVVCTPRLKGRYEKTAAPDAGRGATYEGAIVTQRIYDDVMRNTKFYPILPDGGSEDDIPTALKSWWNGHRFPGGNEGIRRMVFAESAGVGSAGPSPAGGAETGASPWSIGPWHGRLAARLLSAVDASLYFQALQEEMMADEFTGTSASLTAAAMVQRFAECPAEQVQQLFYVVRRALLAVPLAGGDHAARHAAEEAAVALYCLAACRLVDRALRAAPVMHVPSGEPLVCAIIATELCGGELRLVPAEQPSVPRPEYVFEVRVPAGGDQVATDFERAAFVALFQNDPEATEVALDSAPLKNHQRAKLAAHIGEIRHVRRCSMALVVYGLAQTGHYRTFATEHQVPILLPASEATRVLVGMDADRLRAEIHKFWETLEVLSRPARSAPHIHGQESRLCPPTDNP